MESYSESKEDLKFFFPFTTLMGEKKNRMMIIHNKKHSTMLNIKFNIEDKARKINYKLQKKI